MVLSPAKAWVGVAESKFDLKVLCKGKYLMVGSSVLSQLSGGEVLSCHRAILASASSFLSGLLQGHKVRWSHPQLDHGEPTKVETKEGSWVEVASAADLLVLDQVAAAHLQGLLCLLYNGFADVTLDSAAELKDVWEHLGVDLVK